MQYEYIYKAHNLVYYGALDIGVEVQTGDARIQIYPKLINRVELLIKQFVNCQNNCVNDQKKCNCYSKLDLISAKLILDFLGESANAQMYVCKILTRHNISFFELVNYKKKLIIGDIYYQCKCLYWCKLRKSKLTINKISNFNNIIPVSDYRTSKLTIDKIYYNQQNKMQYLVTKLEHKKNKVSISYEHAEDKCDYDHIYYENNAWYIINNFVLISTNKNQKIVYLNPNKIYMVNGVMLHFDSTCLLK